MSIKFTVTGVMIYLAMAVLATALVAWRKRRGAGMAFYVLAFFLIVAAVVHHSISLGRAPLGNLFEVFLVLAAVMFPLSLFCRNVLGIGYEAADAFIALLILVPCGFVFAPMPGPLPPALQSQLFVPHVAAYMLAYAILAKAGVIALAVLIKGGGSSVAAGPGRCDMLDRTVRMGFPLLTIGLILGAVWGKFAWGDYWNWDPKELWSLATWTVFAGYFHFRWLVGRRRPRLTAAIALIGAVFIVITLLWVNLSRIFGGLHSYA